MKKLIYVCLIFGLGVTYFNNAQAQSQGQWGAVAGVNFANINGDPDFDTTSRTGFMLGVNYKFLLVDGPFYLQPELSYTQKGYEGASGETTFKFNYISAAALVSYYFAIESESVIPFVKAGPYLDFNTSAKVEFDDGDEQDLDGVTGTDLGIKLRAGVQINQFEVGARLSQGLTSATDSGSDPKNFLFGFFVGLNI